MFLNKIIQYKKSILEVEKIYLPIEKMILEKRENYFLKSLDSKKFSFICELKKASPSKGIIRENFDYINIAKDYENSGASAVSVLTEDKYFLGNIEYMRELEFLKIPRLRKDFIIDEYQIYQSIHYKADGVLLIVKALSRNQLKKYIKILNEYKIDPLIEVHNLEELKIALEVGGKIIGVNNRNLETFEVSLNVSKEIIENMPSDVIAISESGIKTRDDVIFLENLGFNGVLIGETLMKSNSIELKLRELSGNDKG